MLTIALIVLAATVMWLVYPLIHSIRVTYANQRVPLMPDLTFCGRDDLPPDWDKTSGWRSGELGDLGFAHQGFLGPLGSELSYLELSCNAEHRIAGSVIRIDKGPKTLTTVELTTRFSDGTLISSSNSRTPSIFHYPRQMSMHKSGSSETRQLLTEHLAAVAAEQAGRTAIDPLSLDRLAVLRDENAEVIEYQAKRGLLKPSKDRSVYRFTLFGAARSCFKVWSRFSHLRHNSAT
jgi:hypothetical protein